MDGDTGGVATGPTGECRGSSPVTTVFPGKGASTLRLGLPKEALRAAYGEPRTVYLGRRRFTPDHAPTGAYHAYTESGLAFRFDHVDRVAEIVVRGRIFAIGSPCAIVTDLSQVEATLGTAHQLTLLANKSVARYPRLGIEFVLDGHGKMVSVSVFCPCYQFRAQCRFSGTSPSGVPDDSGTIGYHRSDYHRDLVQVLNSLHFSDQEHGLGHAHRVATMCMAFSSQMQPEGDNPEGYYMMGFLHDCGRASDAGGSHHGERSAQLARSLGLDLPEVFLDAMRCHASKNTPDTLQEQCLFDADRLDLRRFGKQLDPKRLSVALSPVLSDYVVLSDLLTRSKHCCFVAPNIRSRKAMEFYLYLHRHLEYLKPRSLYHGSTARGLTRLRTRKASSSTDGDRLYATADPAEAAYVILRWREPSQQEYSIYELDTDGVVRVEYSLLGVEFVFGEEKRPVREYSIRPVPDQTPFEQYVRFQLSDAGSAATHQKRLPPE